MHATIDANQPPKSLVATVSFVIAMLFAAVTWTLVGLLAVVFVPKVAEALRDFGLRGSTLTTLSFNFSAWMSGQQAGQGVPGSIIGMVIGLLAFASLGFLSVRRRRLAAGLAALLAVVGAVLVLVLYLGMYDGSVLLSDALQRAKPR